ncbi:MAG: 3-hydroxyacyl-ACP dehydratase FabZ [Bdellovibrionia bacterium]
MENSYYLNVNQIQRFLPHRNPFLLVDRVLEIHAVGGSDQPPPSAQVGTRVVALKSVTINEPYFQGHFPGFAIVPGVLIIETMAQAASFSVYPSMAKDIDRLSKDFQCILVGVDGARFRRPVVPGDCMRIETEVKKSRGKIWSFACMVTVDGQKVAEAEILANIIASNSSSNSNQTLSKDS